MVERRPIAVASASFPESESKSYRLADLATSPRWVAWREEERTNKDGSTFKTKIPYDPNRNGQARIPTDPSTYGTRREAEARWRQLDDGGPGGIGIVLGDIDGVCLGGNDHDSCFDPETDTIAGWPAKVLERFNTYSEFSPSGEGIKSIFRCEPKCLELLAKNADGKPKTRESFTRGQHEEMALDFGRFYTITGNRLEEFPETISFVDIEDIKWFLKVAGPAYRGVQGSKTGKTGTRGQRDQSGSGFGLDFMRQRIRAGDTYEAACAAIRADKGKAGEWANRVDERQLERAWAKAVEIEEKKSEKQVNQLIAIVQEDPGVGDLFHDPENTTYADLITDDHRETWPIRSDHFKRWLMRQFYNKAGTVPAPEAVNSAIRLIEANALFDGEAKKVHLRTAEGDDGCYYLDLCDKGWHAVKISPTGWKIVKNPLVRFIRRKGMLPLPFPAKGGSIEDLSPFVNVDGDRFTLLVSWLVAALRPRGPYPVLIVWGTAGSAKSTLLSTTRALIDPNVAVLRAPPKDSRDLFIAATNAYMPTFDNLSMLPPWLSDMFARLATGGGFATRQLYSDDDERLFNATRPIQLGGIESIITRGDLADRAVHIKLDPIPDEKRKLEREFWPAFEKARPRILGALLDAVAYGMRELPNVRLKGYPRMADFVEWMTACEGALWEPGTFATAYEQNRQDAVADLMEGNLVAITLRRFITECDDPWTGSATELLVELNRLASEEQRRQKSWPKGANVLRGKLTRLEGHLGKLGIEVLDAGDDPETRVHLITIRRASGCDPGKDRSNRSDRSKARKTGRNWASDTPSDSDEVSLGEKHFESNDPSDPSDPSDPFPTSTLEGDRRRKTTVRNPKRFIYRADPQERLEWTRLMLRDLEEEDCLE